MAAHTLRGNGHDASEDGTGRGIPLIAFNSREDPEVTYDRSGPLGASSPQAQAIAIQERAVSENANAGPDGAGWREGSAYTIEARTQVQAVAYDMRGREGGARFEGPHETANIRAADGGSSRSYVAQQWAVRRLSTVECERLQGFPDGYTDVRPNAKKGTPDGPRYKALGNSMAVNVMRAVGMRIDIINKHMRGGQ
jgi:DNA (cytosine-5)-methyltransferase 1